MTIYLVLENDTLPQLPLLFWLREEAEAEAKRLIRNSAWHVEYSVISRKEQA